MRIKLQAPLIKQKLANNYECWLQIYILVSNFLTKHVFKRDHFRFILSNVCFGYLKEPSR